MTQTPIRHVRGSSLPPRQRPPQHRAARPVRSDAEANRVWQRKARHLSVTMLVMTLVWVAFLTFVYVLWIAPTVG